VKFAVGYQSSDADERPFVDVAREFAPAVDEVYFPWLDSPSGRSPVTAPPGVSPEEARERLMADLRAFRSMGLRLNLLLNASCYGPAAVSTQLADGVRSVVAHLADAVGLDVVTTMSPAIAQLIREDFPHVAVRASVNMRLGTVKSFEYVADLFDSFTVQREHNRDLARLGELRDWCRRRGKTLQVLANSGCLNYCSVQTFHDNLVAHEGEMKETAHPGPPALCLSFLGRRENWAAFLGSSWIRPEDVRRYEEFSPVVKLATRMHANPRQVIRAYAEGRFAGNLPDLFEPGHGPLFYPYVFNNTRFPPDWFDRTTRCDKRCHACDYCAQVLDRVLVRIGAPTEGLS